MNLTLTILDWIVLSLVVVGSLSFGLYMAYRKKAGQNSSNFFLGGRSMKWPIVGASMFATNIGAEHLVGLSGDSYRYGLSAGSVELTCAITLGFACAILYPYYIKNKIFTIPEFLELRYNRRARTLFSGLMLVISIITIKQSIHLHDPEQLLYMQTNIAKFHYAMMIGNALICNG